MESINEYEAVTEDHRPLGTGSIPAGITGPAEVEFVRRLHARDEHTSLDDLCEGLDIPPRRLKEVLDAVRRELEQNVKDCRCHLGFYDGIIQIVKDLNERANTTVEDRIRKASDFLPDLGPLCYPRRYKRPQGYASPSALIIPAVNAIWGATFVKPGSRLSEEERKNENAAAFGSYFLTCRLIDLKVPTYFVGDNMAEAVARTDLPKDFSLQNLQWPHDALLFQLPKDKVRCPGGSVVSIATGRITPGTYSINGFRYSGRRANNYDIKSFTLDRPECHIMAISNTGQVFFWNCPMDASSVYDSSNTKGGGLFIEPNPDETEFINNDLPILGLQLILCMIACPEKIETGRLWTPQKRKRGVIIQSAVWHPNFFGKTYSPKTRDEDLPPDDGPKGSVRMHWRRGHFRGQRHGPGYSLCKVIWIEPVLVNSHQPLPTP